MPNLEEVLSALKVADERHTYHKLDFYQPYPKQQEFHDAGRTHRERLLMAGNQVGKSYCGAAETAMHLTGLYSSDWFGRKWDRPTVGWSAGLSAEKVRNIPQSLLCGQYGVVSRYGTGLIPRECFADKPSLTRGTTDAYDTIQVKHSNNGGDTVDGVSTLQFKSYEQGREKFQSDTIDFLWLDEEPDEDVYGEALTRITATKGMLFMTFTPLQGMSKVVRRFLSEPSVDRHVTRMTIDDAQHIPPEEREKIIAGYQDHEREARARGTPMLGSGAIYPYSSAQITEPAIEFLPQHWTKLWSIDFGISKDHPFAAVLMAWDKDMDCLHVVHTIKMTGGLPLNHAVPMKVVGANVPVAWPHDGNNRDKGGTQTSLLYKQQNLIMLPTHATWPDGGNSVEAGILEIQQRVETNRIKVASHLSDWLEEQREYHRKDGLVVKQFDDLMDATRYGVMMRRFGKAVNLGGLRSKRKGQIIADGIDFDLT